MRTKYLLISLGLMGSLLVNPGLALAQSVSPSPIAGQSQKLFDLRTKCDQAVDQRVTSLNSDSNRINGLVKLSSDLKSKYNGQIQTNISGLTTLKAKCDGDADLNTLKTDYKNVFLNFRIYAVFLPQTNLLTASDTMDVTADKLQDLYTKLQSRVQSAGNPANLTTLLADMQAKITAAKTQYSNAQSLVTPLTPQSFNTDPNGTKNIVTNAKNDIKAGAGYLKTAFQDAKDIRAALPTTKPSPTPR